MELVFVLTCFYFSGNIYDCSTLAVHYLLSRHPFHAFLDLGIAFIPDVLLMVLSLVPFEGFPWFVCFSVFTLKIYVDLS